MEDFLYYLYPIYPILWLVLFIIGIYIDYLIAKEFERIAHMKGHYSGKYRKYFWWCFCIMPVGISMVIALPAVNQQNNNIGVNNSVQTGTSDYSLPKL